MSVVISIEVEEIGGTDLFVTAEKLEAAEITVMIVMTIAIVMIVAVVAVMSWYADVGRDNILKR